ncbi:hypothetical protein PHSC3_000150 [Chlamydiales bacterium STE3]|nr:hypothetical protein PHSC3_000150 [Chlamydiales bacterium STE3]
MTNFLLLGISFLMDFISNSPKQVKEMMSSIGISNIEDLFQQIPKDLLLQRPEKDDGLSEWEGKQLIEKISAKNTYLNYKTYLGGEAYEYHIPAIVPSICSRGEFLTSYTPYQAKASQGLLQAIFEFQSGICALTKMKILPFDASGKIGKSALRACILPLSIFLY